MKPILIVKTGDTLPEISARRGDFEDWIEDGLALRSGNVEVVSVHEGDALPAAGSVAAVVVTGSSAMVTERRDWSVRTALWLPALVEVDVPLLGICYGHQLLAEAMGGRVGPNPNGRQIGTAAVRLRAEGDGLLGEIARAGGETSLHVSHVESVLALPRGARLLASTALDPHHAFQVGRRAWGVQFHPEFDADVMRGYLEGRRSVVAEEGLDPDALLEAVDEAPAGAEVLRRFGEIAVESER